MSKKKIENIKREKVNPDNEKLEKEMRNIQQDFEKFVEANIIDGVVNVGLEAQIQFIVIMIANINISIKEIEEKINAKSK